MSQTNGKMKTCRENMSFPTLWFNCASSRTWYLFFQKTMDKTCLVDEKMPREEFSKMSKLLSKQLKDQNFKILLT